MSDSKSENSDSGNVSVEHVAHMTGKTKRTIRRWCKEGKIDAEKEGNTWKIDPASVPRSRTGSSGGISEGYREEEGRGEDILADKIIELSRQNALLEEQLRRSLPAGETDPDDAQQTIAKMKSTLKRIAGLPFVRFLIPAELRRKLQDD